MNENGYFNDNLSLEMLQLALKKSLIEIEFIKPLQANEWFEILSRSKFPHYINVRDGVSLEHSKKPDFFHDFIGHVPMLSNEEFIGSIINFSKKYIKQSEEVKCQLIKLWFYTIEFGVVKSNHDFKLFGGGAVSSHIILDKFKKKEIKLKRFEVKDVINHEISVYGEPKVFFYFNSYEELIKEFNLGVKYVIR